MDYALLGKRIHEERIRLNLTQEKLAEAVNISTAYLGQIERGERQVTLDKLIPIANRLGVSIDFLLIDYVSPKNDLNIDFLFFFVILFVPYLSLDCSTCSVVNPFEEHLKKSVILSSQKIILLN